MFDYRPQAWRPHPRVGQAIVAPPVVTTSPAVVAPTGAPSMFAPEGLFWTALAAGAAYASLRTATRKNEKTLAQVAGWAGGVAAGLGAVFGLLGVLAPSTARTLPLRWYWVA